MSLFSKENWAANSTLKENPPLCYRFTSWSNKPESFSQVATCGTASTSSTTVAMDCWTQKKKNMCEIKTALGFQHSEPNPAQHGRRRFLKVSSLVPERRRCVFAIRRWARWQSHWRLRAVIGCLSYGGSQMCNYWTLVISACDAIPHSPPQSARYTLAQLAVPHGARRRSRKTSVSFIFQSPGCYCREMGRDPQVFPAWKNAPDTQKILSSPNCSQTVFGLFVLSLKQEAAAWQRLATKKERRIE